MIARLRGRLDTVGDDHVVIDVGGVGYLVYCPQRIIALLPVVGEALDLHVETIVREDSITLYGFTDPAERGLFRMLQTVQGVGARVALAVLSALSLAELRLAVARQDKAALGRASGVGARLAQRIVVELRDRLDHLPAEALVPGQPPAVADGRDGDAVSALVNLGYGRSDAERAIGRARAAAGPDAAIDALIRAGLRELGPA